MPATTWAEVAPPVVTEPVDLATAREGVHSPATPAGSTATALEAQLRPVLEELDREREIQRGEFVYRMTVAVTVVGAAAVVSGLAALGTLGAALRDFEWGAYTIPPLLAALGLGWWAVQPRRRYISAYKTRILPVIAASFGEFRYEETGQIEVQRLRGSTLLPSYDYYESEDMFVGRYKGVDVELAEVRLRKQRGTGKTRHTVTVFKGLFALLSVHKAFSGKTIVKRDAGAVVNWLGKQFDDTERVVLEDPEFEQRFEVYATDQIEARYLLTPAFMERLTQLATDLGGGQLQAAFYNERLFLMVPNDGNLFEPPSMTTTIRKKTGVLRIARELENVLSMIDILKLHERTGL